MLQIKLSRALEQRGIRPSALAKEIGLSTSTVDDILKGKTNELNIGVEKAMKIAEWIGVTVEELYGRATEELSEEERALIAAYRSIPDMRRPVRVLLGIDEGLSARPKKVDNVVPFPLPHWLPQNIPVFHDIEGGLGVYVDGDQPDEYELVVPPGTDYAVYLHGTSMEPEIMDGDLILVHIQETVEPGEIGVFNYNGGMTCKEYTVNNLGQPVLMPRNLDRFDPMPVTEYDEVRVQGKVIGIIRDIALY